MDELEKIRREWQSALRFEVCNLVFISKIILSHYWVGSQYFNSDHTIAPVWPDGSIGDMFTGDGVVRLGLDKVFDLPRIPRESPPVPQQQSPAALAKAFAGEMESKANGRPICLLMPSGAFSGVSPDGLRLLRWDNVQIQMTADDLGMVLPDKIPGQFWVFVRRSLESTAKAVVMVVDKSRGVEPGLGIMGEDESGSPLYVWRK